MLVGRGRIQAVFVGVAVVVVGLAAPLPAVADLPTPATAVGDVVTHPVTGVDATVVEVLENAVLTDNDDVIFVYHTVGDSFADPGDPNDPPATVTITDVVVNADTGFVESFTLDSGDVLQVARMVDTGVPAGAEGAPGDPGGPVPVDVPAGNTGVIAVKLRGSRGGDGNDGYGVEICDPFFGTGCIIIGYGGTGGGDGGTGPTVTINATEASGDIESISHFLPGITGTSIGGNGGAGGDAYGNFDGRPGGDAGEGGTVNITSDTTITTSGILAHGIFGQSRSGQGGAGGSGYIFGGGGTGGQAAQGGTVSITNNGDITTFGAGAVGMYGQSTGGSAGSGGDSWGIVGSGGSSRAGGNGGTVTLTNNGNIITSGYAAHGMLSQSIGGTGGDGGSAGGVVSFGGGGSAGGNGGTANGNLGANASIRTIGNEAHGMFVQSTGGGGGHGGTGGGVVAFGGTGSAGGNGGAVNVNNAAGGLIVTEGDGSYAILAQSIGGGGGDGGTGGGVVALGGDGSAAGHGGTVTVNNAADLRTVGEDAFGIMAHSVGGGGGTARTSGGVVTLGGAGGSGGDGGTVTLTNNGIIQTDGSRSDAIVAQSVGKGGGSGGGSFGAVALGGEGSGGGEGGTINLTNNGQLTTLGDHSRGIYAQSTGGGGGFGGDSGGLVAIGGRGSDTSDGGTVTLTNTGAISTGQIVVDPDSGEVTITGEESHAIEAQSIGGGGGDGGTTGGVFFTLGGTGGGGGDGGSVTVNNSNDLSTVGTDARGILAQSTGGGGGNGGSSYSGSAFAGVAIGGRGAVGGDGGDVTLNASDYTRLIDGEEVQVTPLIQTQGANADGIFLQSTGGGGGTGGLAVQVTGGAFGAVSVAVGGTGGGGGDGGDVTLTGDSTVVTAGRNATGVFLESTGGGGGSGGGAISVGIAGGPGAGSIAVGVGGSGGDGGDGGTVTSTGGGNIVTSGDFSEGFFAQSVGGGGGEGGYVVNASVAGSAALSVAVGVGVGGIGGGGGEGGDVNATYAGDVTTSGFDADAWTAQSEGGGGGKGGFNISGAIAGGTGVSSGIAVGVGGAGGGGGNAASATGDLTGDITTTGDQSGGMMVQSAGGGGGMGGFNISGNISAGSVSGGVSVGVGGAGGGGGDGGAASLTYTGTARTEGSDAVAVFAQSQGGGGGQGAFNVSGGISGSASGSAAISVGVGGAGGDGGDGGTVTSSVTGTVITMGNGSDGVITQSQGGGGGQGGINVSGDVAISSVSGTASIGVGGAGGGGGHGGMADATIMADVTTEGDDAIAVLTQSLGGGGGRGALNVSGGIAGSASGSAAVMVGVGGSGGDGGNAEAVTSSVTGDITTHGARSDGMVVESQGGGGGQGGLNVSGGLVASSAGGNVAVGVGGAGGGGGDGSTVNATLTGDLTTHGDGSRGAVIQSLGGGGGQGGMNISGGVSLTSGGGGGISVGVGGFGGDGGASDTAELTLIGDVTTGGTESHGVFVQSQGGGGGAGGLNVSGNVSLSSAVSVPIAVGVGGFGGGGGDAADAILTLTGNTTTSGANTDAVTVQSVGGGGGKGGINISGNLAVSTGGTAFGSSLGLGGFGGEGGNAGDVTALVSGNVFASGVELDAFEFNEDGVLERVREGGSNGIIAQSIGGSGGNGGLNVAAGISGGPSSGALNLGVGGFGGGGGNAGTVDLTVIGDQVFSYGDNRNAVSAQSIGGGGGHGALNVAGGITGNGQLTAGVGGFGGDGGTSGDVTASVSSSILAYGAGSRGLLAESIGGGGGNGGINISGGINVLTSANAPSLIFGIGGSGGAGNSSATVTATQDGNVVVYGRDSIGVLAQSIGGGGGSGALNVSGSLAAGQGFVPTVGIGGRGGVGADAGAVTLTSDGFVFVDGRTLDESNVPVAEDPEDVDFSARANGILVQSIGGGGGNGGLNVTGAIVPFGHVLAAGVGGTGGGGGHAGAVIVDRGMNETALLETTGNQSNGLTAQSIGGGGGDAGMNFVFSANGAGDPGAFESNIVVGGGGGDPGHGSTVTVNHMGEIRTAGEQSNGLLAQSVGGGGGNAAISLGAGLNRQASGVNLAVGGGPGEGGNGDLVSVTHLGDISTQGADSMGIYAQSVGGGGGNAAMTMAFALLASNKLDVGVGRRGGTGGTGGDVFVDAGGGALSTAGDRAVGLFAQSVGGGGGRSGANMIGAKGTSGEGDTASSASFGLSVGLEGGVGADAGDVNVDVASTITTQGEAAHAVHAQSVGGGGGVGGGATNLVMRETAAARVGVGGEGGTGGLGGLVDVLNTGTLTTYGDGAHGLYVQSIGGGGGTGGMAGLLSLQIGGQAGNGNNNLGVSVGGVGGSGTDAGEVVVTNQGSITTNGGKSHGIDAQSIGGGGGDGGMVISGTLSGAGRQGALNVNVGGFGGTGGDGSTVTVSNEHLIRTTGDESIGVRAQSVGGGGGNAGLVLALDIAKPASEGSSMTLGINIGGTGGTGGDGGTVDVANQTGGSIITGGNKAYGVFAQSIGGGGGNGSSVLSAGFSGGTSKTVGFNLGGSGGVGGVGGSVNVVNDDLIDTTGDSAHGIFAQSTGGGGGTGGLAIATNAILGAADGGGGLTMGIGGAGGDGGDGGAVVVSNRGNIVTRGVSAHGILAQSVGGGGGDANIGVGLSNPLVASVVSNVISGVVGALLTNGGDGGSGGTVTVNHSGDITVLGDRSEAIRAESINGGGGGLVLDFNGVTSLPGGEGLPFMADGSDPGLTIEPLLQLRAGGDQVTNTAAGSVIVNNSGTFGAAGDNSVALGLQSIGGGGGTTHLDLDFAPDQDGGLLGITAQLGGLGGSNNGGSQITSSYNGDMITNGRHSPAAALQSIGGGGGRSLMRIERQDESLGDVQLIIGGDGVGDSDGGNVAHVQVGNLITTGDNAPAFLAQSIGAGGGEAHISGTDNLSLVLGGQGGASGNGGDIDLSLTGGAFASGNRSHGVLLQSIGGGGGALFADAGSEVAIDLSAANSGDGGDVRFELHGDIAVSGAEAMGLIVQSLGGGGGFADGVGTLLAGGQGAGGDISILLNSGVRASAGTAIYLQSDGSDSGGDILLSLASDGVIAGGEEMPSLVFDGGADNLFINHGVLGSAAGESGLAMLGTHGNDGIDNYGFILGNLNLGGGANALTNRASAYVLSGAAINLGNSAAVFTNSGTLSPGDLGLARETLLTGSYVQAPGALALMELDFERDLSDALLASGTAAVDGAVTLSLLNAQAVRPGRFSKTLFGAEGGLTNEGLALTTAPSVVINYELVTDDQHLDLGYEVDFVPDGMGENLNAIGDYINRGQRAGGGDADWGQVIELLVYKPDLDSYADALSDLSPEIYAEHQSRMIDSGIEFGRRLMSCKQTGGEHRFSREGSCIWGIWEDEERSLDAHDGFESIDTDTRRVAIGGQRTLDNDWSIGAGLSRDRSDSNGANGSWDADSLVYQIGLSAKKRIGASKFTGVLTYGSGDTETVRRGMLVSPFSARVDRSMKLLTLALRAQHDFEFDSFYFRPKFDLGFSRLKAKDAQEKGAGAASLVLEDIRDKHTWIRPALEAGKELELGSKHLLRFTADFGIQQYIGDTTTEVSARFVGLPPGVAPMQIASDLGDPLYGASVGVDFLTTSNFVVQFYYQRNWSDDRDTDAFRLKLELPF